MRYFSVQVAKHEYGKSCDYKSYISHLRIFTVLENFSVAGGAHVISLHPIYDMLPAILALSGLVTLNFRRKVTSLSHHDNSKSNILSYTFSGARDTVKTEVKSMPVEPSKDIAVGLGPPVGNDVPYRCHPGDNMAFIIATPSDPEVIFTDTRHVIGADGCWA